MGYKLEEIFEINELRNICESFTELTGYATAVLDIDGKVYISAGRQSICTNFHRCNTETNKRCIDSDTILSKQIKESKKYSIYKCKNGLIDVAMPIIIDDVHLGNLFIGQFLLEEPDIDYFIKQGKKFGFSEKEYLSALEKVPIYTEEQVKKVIKFLVQLTLTIGDIGLRNLENIEIRKQLELEKNNLTETNTNLQNIQSELIASEKKFRSYIENAPDGIFIADENGKYLEVNKAACKLTGYSEKELLELSIPDLIQHDYLELAKKSFREVVETGFTSSELGYLTKTGKKRFWTIDAVKISDNRYMGFTSDITDRVNAENDIKESEEKFSKAFDLNPNSLAIIDLETKNRIEVNDYFAKLTGYSKQTLINNPLGELDEIDMQKVEMAIKSIRNGKSLKDVEVDVKDRFGNKRLMLYAAEGIKIGDRDCMIVSGKDITLQKLAEKKLIESEEKLKAVINNNPFPIAVVDEKKQDILFWSKSATDLFGYDPATYDEWFNYAFPNLEYRNKFINNWKSVLKSARTSDEAISAGEHEICCKNGDIKTCFVYIQFITNSLIITFNDITARKIAELELIAKNKEYEEINIELQLINKELIKSKEEAEESEQKFKTLFKENNSVQLLINPETGYIIDANQAACDFYGYNIEELTALRISEINQYSEDRVREEMMNAKHRNVNYFEFQHKLSNGDIRDVEVYSNPITIDNTKYLISIIHDVTDRKNTERELIAAKEQTERNEIELRRVQELAQVGSWYLEIETNIVTWTKELYNMFGFDPNLPPPNFTEFEKLYTPQSWSKLIKAVNKAVEKGVSYELELNNVRKDGTNGWMWVRGEAIKDKNGKIIALWGAAQDVSERKRLEIDLQTTSELLNTTGKMAKVGGYSINLADNSMKWTDETYRIFELTKENQPSITETLNYYHPDDRKMVTSVVEKSLSDGKPFEYEARLITGKKNLIWVKGSGSIINLNEGNKVITGSLQDITQIKQSQLELIKAKEDVEENERLLSKIAENFPNSYLSIIEKDLTVGFTSGQEFHRLNLDPVDFVGLTLKDVFGDYEQIVKENYLKTFDGEETSFELFYNNQYQHYKTVPLYNDKNEITRILSVAENITSRKEKEKELLAAKEKAIESEKNLLIAQELAHVGSWEYNIDDDTVSWSKELYNIFELSPDMPPPAFADQKHLYSEQGYTTLKKAVQDCIQFETPYEIELEIKTASGKQKRIISIGNVKKDAENNVIGCYGTAQDVTLQKKLESELIRAKEKAEESDRLKSAFLANMSHEIRTPMNGILGFTDLLMTPNLSGEKREKYIEIIGKSGKRMLSTVNDIIDISKIDAGQVEITHDKIDINSEIESHYEFFNIEAAAKDLELKLINKLPDANIIIDKQKFDSIITNLIKNAIKYTDTGSIVVYCDKKEDKLEIKITDTGIGIPKDRINSIFNRFEQADIFDRNAREGSGLGLSIAMAYVDLLGGQIGVNSEEGKGSTFYFSVPWVEDKEKHEIETNEEIVNSSEPLNKKLDILIAEDDDTSFEFLEIILVGIAKSILRVYNGKEAIEIMKQKPEIDLILMDIKMPIMNGYKATSEIRKFNKDVIIIAQTAYALEGDDNQAFSVGCNDYVSKPISGELLLEVINKYIKH